MTDERFINAYEGIEVDGEQSERIWARLMAGAEEASANREVVSAPQKRRKIKVWRTALLAAVIAGAMGVTAYAMGIFGREALEVKEPEITPQKLIVGEDGKGYTVDNPGKGGVFSLTQPQDLPEDMNPAVREKVENSRAAWAEWTAWREEHRAKPPAAFLTPEEALRTETVENPDGSWTMIYYACDKSQEELEAWWEEIRLAYEAEPEQGEAAERAYTDYLDDSAHWIELERRTASPEEVREYLDYQRSSASGYPGYDYWYGVRNGEQAQKLEEIAARYGLVLRGDQQTMFGRSGDYYAVHGKPDFMTEELYEQELQDEQGNSAEEMLSLLSAQCCRGSLFLTPPPFIDHLYWYQEGTFGVMYDWKLSDGRIASCYLYNSMYGTLSSGLELFEEIEDVSAYTARAYLTEDGTEVTILESSHLNAWGWHDDSYIFVYLDDSFLVIHVNQPEGITGEELEAIADSIQYSVINKE